MSKLIIFSAPSGSGKTTIVKEIMKQYPNLKFSISATTRPMRKGEQNGVDYHFLSPEEFKKKIKKNEFAEWEEVYTDRFYGTLNSEIERIWQQGNHVVFDVDVKGGLNLKKHFAEKALAIFVKAPSIQELEKRLKARATDSREDIKSRVEKAEYEMSFAPQFDKIIINDKLQEAVEKTSLLIAEFLKNK